MAGTSKFSRMGRKEKTGDNGAKLVMNPGVNESQAFTDESTVKVMNPNGSVKSTKKMKVSK